MTTMFELENDVGIIDDVSAAESDDDDRENQIKELLQGALENESFYEDDESETSFVQPGNNPRDENGNGGVSVLHRQHCPKQLGLEVGNGDCEDESQVWLGSSETNQLEQLRTLCDARQRQLNMCETKMSALAQEKRSLSHETGILRTEMVQMKSTQDDLEKSNALKCEEIAHLKLRIQEIITDFEDLRRNGSDLRDENNCLHSEISRLEQEVKIASTIGSKVNQNELSEAIRQVREKHAREIASWKSTVADLEGQIAAYKVTKFKDVTTTCAETQTPKESKEQEVKTSTIESIVNQNEVDEAIRQMREKHTREIAYLKSAVRDLEGQIAVHRVHRYKDLNVTSAETQTCIVSSKDAGAQFDVTRGDSRNSLREVSNVQNVSVIVQTDETLGTYEVLAGLIEQWALEVGDSAKRAELAETQAKFTEESLKKLRRRFRDVIKMVAICRKEWKSQEQSLKKKHAETKAHYINLLLNLGQTLESLDRMGNVSQE